MQILARLVHVGPSTRIVEVRALEAERLLGSALGEAESVEAAEQRALERLLTRLEEPAGRPSLPPVVAPAAARPEMPPPPKPQPQPPLVRPATASPPPAATGAAPVAALPELPEDGSGDPGSQVPELAAEAEREPAPERAAPEGARPAALEEPPPDAPADPEDWSEELARLDLGLRRLGWTREAEAAYLQRAFGHPSRSRLTSYADLVAYLRQIEALEPGADPDTTAVPLRRRDLIGQGDQLLQQLGWDTDRARLFLRERMAVASRSQLNDEQLLRFNMELEAELLNLAAGGG